MKKAIKFFRLVIGAALMATAVNLVFSPMHMVVGGVTGIGITANRILQEIGWKEIPLWVYNLAFNIPLVLWAWRSKGLTFVGKTIVGIGLHTFFLWLIPERAILEEDYFLAAIVGGVISGLGIGQVFRASASTGGSDLLSVLLTKPGRGNAPDMLMWIDGTIVAMGCVAFGLNTALYSVMAVYIITKLSDGVLEGFNYAKTVYVVTNHAEGISKCILENVNRGVSSWSIKGMYTGEERTMLMCIVEKRELGLLREVIAEHDPAAFILIQQSGKAVGKGFVESEQ